MSCNKIAAPPGRCAKRTDGPNAQLASALGLREAASKNLCLHTAQLRMRNCFAQLFPRKIPFGLANITWDDCA